MSFVWYSRHRMVNLLLGGVVACAHAEPPAPQPAPKPAQTEQTAQQPPSSGQAGAAGQPAQTPAPTEQPAGQKTFSQQELDELLAPIALYPDTLLAQVLMASTYPLELVEAARWRKENPDLKEKALEDALEKQGWDASVKSIVAVPAVLEMMDKEIAWTQKLGDAFLAQEADVTKTVQMLRAKAKENGTLETTEQQTVKEQPEGDTTVVVIEQSDPQVVYVPAYNPAVVYGPWWYPTAPPYAYHPAGAVIGAGIAFTAGAFVGAAMWGGFRWGAGGYGSVNVNVNRYNSFNRTNINNSNWNHNVDHRRGVAYRDQGTAQRYNRGGDVQAAQAREQFRGRAEAAGGGERAAGAEQRAAERGAGGGERAAERGTGGGAGSERASQRSGSSSVQRREGGASRSGSGFSGAGGGGSSTRAASSRGSASRGGGGRGRR